MSENPYKQLIEKFLSDAESGEIKIYGVSWQTDMDEDESDGFIRRTPSKSKRIVIDFADKVLDLQKSKNIKIDPIEKEDIFNSDQIKEVFARIKSASGNLNQGEMAYEMAKPKSLADSEAEYISSKPISYECIDCSGSHGNEYLVVQSKGLGFGKVICRTDHKEYALRIAEAFNLRLIP